MKHLLAESGSTAVRCSSNPQVFDADDLRQTIKQRLPGKNSFDLFFVLLGMRGT
jgi:hypothetical protein